MAGIEREDDSPTPTEATMDNKEGQEGNGPPMAPREKRSGPPVFPEERILVSAWPDPTLDSLGHDPRSVYVEKFWLSILGPSSLLLLRRLALKLEASPGGFEVDPVAWAFELGLGMRGGKNGPFWRSIERTSRFNATYRQGDRLLVRRKLAPLNLHQVDKLPPHLQVAHQKWTEQQLTEHRTARGDAA